MRFNKAALLMFVMLFMLFVSACSNRTEQTSSELSSEANTVVSSPSAVTSIEESETPSSETVPTESGEAPQTQAMTFFTLKESFFGTWMPDPAEQTPNQRGFSVGYGNLNFGDGGRLNEFNSIRSADVDESSNVVLEVIHGGELYLYTVSPDKPGVMTVVSVDGDSGSGLDGTYTKTAEAAEATDVFGYMDILEFCSGGWGD